MKQSIYQALKDLRHDLPDLAQLLKLSREQEIESWAAIVDIKLLTRFLPDFPIVAAICGGGSSGKSTLFNSLLGEKLAPTGGRAGMNRRLLFSVPAERRNRSDIISSLLAPYHTIPHPMQDPNDLLTPGTPLYVPHHCSFKNIILIDTPDFDTGAGGQYTNREITQRALEAADVLIYIFTNSNYNNRDNTDFISQMLTGIGYRKCFLVYRVYPSFTMQEVHDHAMVVARAIYGDKAEHYLLGIYRSDEDNQVAAGKQFMTLRPARPMDPDFWNALGSINTHQLRFELHASILADVLAKCTKIFETAKLSLNELQLYHDALQIAQRQCMHAALKHFPMDRVLRRFARVWSQTDPAHVKLMRKTGALIEFPLKVLISAAGWTKSQLYSESARRASNGKFADKLDEDLVTAVTSMHHQAVSPHLTLTTPRNDPMAARMLETLENVRTRKSAPDPPAEPTGDGLTYTFTVDVHPAALPAQENLRRNDFKSILQAILAHKETVAGISHEMEKDLKGLANHFRSKMNLWAKVSQTFWAFMNVLPATVAVTYVLSTGDPIGAAGIKVKLTGLFGAKDLYALFAIPATTGLKKADQKQLEIMLGPIVQTWLAHKLKIVHDLFTEHITGGIIQATNESLGDARRLIAAIETSLQKCTREVVKP